MSDSDADNSNVFPFQNTTVSARGPNTNFNFKFRSKYVPPLFERQRYAESVSDQRSIYYRRETSPMSIQSACDFRSRNFQQYYNRMGSQQSVYNGRSGSPGAVSMRSIDSSASVSAADIAFALSNVKFNKYDLKVIKEAYQKAMKQRIRKRIEKRRNMRLFLKGNKHRSGDDSGEQGSDSSLSSDDHRSIKTTHKENILSSTSRVNLTDFQTTINTTRDGNRVNDCAESFRENNFKNMFPISRSNYNRNHTFNNTLMSQQVCPAPTQRDRFQNNFLLPSQRFNRSVASSVIPENIENHHRNIENNFGQGDRLNRVNSDNGSDEEIFSARDKVTNYSHSQQKRSFENDNDSSLPNKKKAKISSPTNQTVIRRNVSPQNNSNCANDFKFAKPTLPVKKSKPKIQEKVIAKSKQPLTGFVEHMPAKIANTEAVVESTVQVHSNNDNQQQADQVELMQNSDVSMRPSFIKRKLFTQKLDVAEKANVSSDASSSPQVNGYGALQKEKNKARKLVSTQSCLNRDVQEDNNLLDLIHKIVPPDRMSVTNQTMTSQSKTDVNNSIKREDDDKWDVTSVISMCNDDDVSDTFTDEEIFENNKVNNANKNMEDNQTRASQCWVVLNKIPYSQKTTDKTNLTTNISTSTVKNSANTFWNISSESDGECQVTTQERKQPPNSTKGKQPKGNISISIPSNELKKPTAIIQNPASNKMTDSTKWLNNMNNTTNRTLGNSRKLNISTLSVRSYTTKKQACCDETSILDTTTIKPVVVDKKMSKSNKNSKEIKSKEDKTVECNRPIRSCRTSIHNQSDADSHTSRQRSYIKENQPKGNITTKQPAATTQSPAAKKSTETSNWLNNTKNNTKVNISTLGVRSYRATKKKKCCDDICIQETKTSKPVMVDKKVSKSRKNTKEVKSKEPMKIECSRPIRSCRISSQNRSIDYSR